VAPDASTDAVKQEVDRMNQRILQEVTAVKLVVGAMPDTTTYGDLETLGYNNSCYFLHLVLAGWSLTKIHDAITGRNSGIEDQFAKWDVFIASGQNKNNPQGKPSIPGREAADKELRRMRLIEHVDAVKSYAIQEWVDKKKN
jgi:hypothetical protein